MTTIVLVHGWGFDARIWDGVIASLPGRTCLTVELGFRGPRVVPWAERPLVVGHSMGFAWALAHLPQPWAGAVAVNGFSCFTRRPGFPHGTPPRLLDRMLARFADAPAEVAADFLTRCGVEDPEIAGLDPAPLGQSLRWLAECDERQALAALDCPVVALAGAADPIVPEAMSRDAFARVEMVAGAGHLLPLTHPRRVAECVAAGPEPLASPLTQGATAAIEAAAKPAERAPPSPAAERRLVRVWRGEGQKK